MKKQINRIFCALAAALLFICTAGTHPAEAVNESVDGLPAIEREDLYFTLSIIHTNDTHAHLDNIARRVQAVKEIRGKKKNVLLVDTGDVFTGTLYFNEFKGQADLAFMNMMEYDAMTFGNHEFDLGASPEGHRALVDFIKGAQFPFVTANINFSKDDKFAGLFSDQITSEPERRKIYRGIIKEFTEEKIGIFGLTTMETPKISNPRNVKFENYLSEAKKTVKAFQKMGINKIILLSHLGFEDNGRKGSDLTLAKKVDGIDIIVGGHSHTELKEPVIVDRNEKGEKKDPTVIVQAGSRNKYTGLVNVKFDQRGVVRKASGKLLKTENFEPDPEAEELLRQYQAELKESVGKETGVILEKTLENPRLEGPGKPGISVRNSETVLGNLVADSILYKAREMDKKVALAVQHGGGIRAEIPAGPVTTGDIVTVLPYSNTLSVVTMTGAELKAALETSLKKYPDEYSGFLQIAGGRVKFDSTKPAGERVINVYVKNKKGEYKLVKDTKTYKVATNFFIAKGGDGHDVFKALYEAGKVKELNVLDWEALRDYMMQLKTVPEKTEDRIVDVGKQAAEGE